MITSVMHESSPWAYTVIRQPSGFQIAHGVLSWDQVLDGLRRYEDTGEIQPALPPDIQRPGALIGLTLGLLARQAALIGRHGWPVV